MKNVINYIGINHILIMISLRAIKPLIIKMRIHILDIVLELEN